MTPTTPLPSLYDEAIAEMEKLPNSFFQDTALAVLRGEREGWWHAHEKLLPRIPENDLTDAEIAWLKEVVK